MNRRLLILLLLALAAATPVWAQFGSPDDRDRGVVFYLSKTAFLTYFDLALLGLCPFFGMLGGMVSRHLTVADIHSKIRSIGAKGDEPPETSKESMRSVPTFGPNAAMVGGVLGVVVALYFVGAITDHVTSLARVFALCILLGYQAPSLWRAQEKVIATLVDDRLRLVLGDKNFIGTHSVAPSGSRALSSTAAPGAIEERDRPPPPPGAA